MECDCPLRDCLGRGSTEFLTGQFTFLGGLIQEPQVRASFDPIRRTLRRRRLIQTRSPLVAFRFAKVPNSNKPVQPLPTAESATFAERKATIINRLGSERRP